ncbi:hypothetical protein ALC60_08305, partial [Trachymyrmex zeteki]
DRYLAAALILGMLKASCNCTSSSAGYSQGRDSSRSDIFKLRPVTIWATAKRDMQLVQNNWFHVMITQLRLKKAILLQVCRSYIAQCKWNVGHWVTIRIHRYNVL